MKKVSTLLVCLLYVGNVFAFDIDLKNGTIYGEPFGSSIEAFLIANKQIAQKKGIPKYPQIGLTYEAKATELGENSLSPWHYSFFLIDWDKTYPNKVPKDFKAFNGTFSHGITKATKFKDCVNTFKTADTEFIAYSGKWCFSYGGQCNEQGSLIISKISNNWYAEFLFDQNNKIIDVEILKDNFYERITDASINSMKLVAKKVNIPK